MFNLDSRVIASCDHNLIRPLLTKFFPPELVVKIYSYGRDSFLKSLQHSKVKVEPDQITKNVSCFKNNLIFRNDLGNAAGFDKDGTLLNFNYNIGAGFALLGTVLNNPHTGNLFPCFGKKRNPWTPLHFSNSALNSLGLPSKGVYKLRENILKFRNSVEVINFPIGVSLMGHPLADEVAKLEGVLECMDVLADCIDFFEINESCPNTIHDAGFDALTVRVKKILQKRSEIVEYRPLIFKLADFGELSKTLLFYSEYGVDALSFTNTLKNYSNFIQNIDLRDLKLFNHYITKYQGGLSGQAIKEYTHQQIVKAAKFIKQEGLGIKLAHIGGLASKDDLERSRAIDSSIVVLRQWYTGLMQSMVNKEFKDLYPSVV
jgi:dihydroorotate dehydrogenase